MFKKRFPAVEEYPIPANDYKAREKAYSVQWQIRFFFIGIFAATTFFLPQLLCRYFFKVEVDSMLLQAVGIVLAGGVMLLSRFSRRSLAKEYGLFCPECEEVFDYWSDKKNAVSFGGICPKCGCKITDIQDQSNSKEKEEKENNKDKE